MPTATGQQRWDRAYQLLVRWASTHPTGEEGPITIHMPATVRVALYVRVSTSRQVQHQTIELQLERLHAHVRAQVAWALREEHAYRDDGYTTATRRLHDGYTTATRGPRSPGWGPTDCATR